MMRKPTLYSEERVCWICGNPSVQLHHVFGGNGRRSVSDSEGCTVYLCHEHHQGRNGAHRSREFDRWLKADCQRRWMEREGKGKAEFIKVFGANYIKEEA